MILADSNIIIYAATGRYPNVTEWFIENSPAVSAISMVEVLGYHKLNTSEKSTLEALFNSITIIYPNPEIFQTAIHLRQQKNISLADALIAATAIYHNLNIATHNTSDFKWIETIKLIDPVE
jgi:predicted nucleic acid-binding protein